MFVGLILLNACPDHCQRRLCVATVPLCVATITHPGPFHFCRGTRRPLGSTILKHRQIKAQGHILVAVPYWEWAQEESLEGKQQLLSTRLAQAKDARVLPDD